MSTSKLITKESLSAYERWELPTVGAPRPQSQDVNPSDVRNLLSAEQVEQIRQAAQKDGFEQGRREGLQAAQKDIAVRMQRLSQIITALAEPLHDVDERVEQELTALALAIARQIIRRELRSDPGEVIAVVREALASLPSASSKIQVFLHPEDAALVREKLAINESEEPSWRIVDEPALTRGGCRVTSDASRIDATVERRLAAVVAKLMGGERSDERPA